MTWNIIQGEGNVENNVETCRNDGFYFVAVFIVLFSYVGNSQAAARLSDIPSTAAKEINYLLDKEIIYRLRGWDF